nr:3-oxoacyl-[acyl-carrier-protein] synthase 3 A, chloroplastic-like [Tanacetum cinerariifolium]
TNNPHYPHPHAPHNSNLPYSHPFIYQPPSMGGNCSFGGYPSYQPYPSYHHSVPTHIYSSHNVVPIYAPPYNFLYSETMSSITLFVRWIKDYPFPHGLKMPSHIGTYDGKGDPNNFLHFFNTIRIHMWVMLVAYHMFTYTLRDSALIWWNMYKPASVVNFKDLKAKFRSHFCQQKKFRKTNLAVHNMKKREGDSTRAFVIASYIADTLKILWLHEEQRISDHGHETNYCCELNSQIEEAMRLRKLAHMVNGIKKRKVSERICCSSASTKRRVPKLISKDCKLVGCGSALPKCQVSNIDLAKIVDVNDEWISSRTGIRNRRILSDKESMHDKSGGRGSSKSTSNGGGGGFKNVLVIGVDSISRYVDWTDRNHCVLFGDAAGAILVQACDSDEDALFGFDLHTDGDGRRYLFGPIKQITQLVAVPQSIEASLENSGHKLSDVDWLLVHQANQRIIDYVARKLDFPKDTFTLLGCHGKINKTVFAAMALIVVHRFKVLAVWCDDLGSRMFVKVAFKLLQFEAVIWVLDAY